MQQLYLPLLILVAINPYQLSGYYVHIYQIMNTRIRALSYINTIFPRYVDSHVKYINLGIQKTESCLNIKTVLPRHRDYHIKVKTVTKLFYL